MIKQLTKEEIQEYEKITGWKVDTTNPIVRWGKIVSYRVLFSNGNSKAKTIEAMRNEFNYFLSKKDPTWKRKTIYSKEQLIFDYKEENWSKDVKVYGVKINVNETEELEALALTLNSSVGKLIKGYLKALLRSKEQILTSPELNKTFNDNLIIVKAKKIQQTKLKQNGGK